MTRFSTAAVAFAILVGAADARGQEPSEVERLKKEVGLLQAKLDAANSRVAALEKENQQLRAGGGKAAGDAKPVPLKAQVNTVGKENMAPWLGAYNSAVKGCKAAKADGTLVVAFDMDMTAWSKIPRTNECYPLLIRVFDEDGNYLTHFTTAEVFTADQRTFDLHNGLHERYTAAFMQTGGNVPADAPPKPVLIKDKENALAYKINKRDLRDAAMIEVGFYEHPRR